ncbi:MAG: MCE family protein, partial [Psychrobium sp.]|nr:MCE family protein [Psychrobium sp.]
MKESQVIEPAQADIKSHNRISKVWLIPFVAFAMSAWMVLDTYYNSGPDIVITFDNAKGLKAGKTRIKTRNVDVGYVDQVLLNDDKSGVIVHVKLDKQVEDLLHDNADFWVVSPKIGRGGISGLSTITSGAYIEFVAGDSHIMSTQFVGLEHEPITAKGVAGVPVVVARYQASVTDVHRDAPELPELLAAEGSIERELQIGAQQLRRVDHAGA